jgi:hypothetical protein
VGGWDLNEERKQLNYKGWEEEEVAKLTTEIRHPKDPDNLIERKRRFPPPHSDVNSAIKFFGLVQKYRFSLNSNDWIQLKSRQADTISFFRNEIKGLK